MADENSWVGTGGGAGGEGPPPGGAPENSGGGEGGGAPGGNMPEWLASLPEELRTDPSLVTHKDIASVVKSYIHAQSLVGRKGIIPPGENATPEQLSQFYEALGRPKTKDEYTLEAAGLPEGMTISPAMTEGFKAKAHEMGLTAKQAKDLFSWYSTQVGDGVRQTQAQKEEAPRKFEAFLAEKFGLNNSQQALQQAGGVLRAFSDDDIMAGIKESGLENSPWFFKLMHNISGKFSEGSLREGGGGGSFNPSPTQAKAEITSIMSNPDDVYWQEFGQAAEQRKQHVLRLQKIISDAAG